MGATEAAGEGNCGFLGFSPDEIAVVDAAFQFMDATTPLGRLHEPAEVDLSPDKRRQFGAQGWFGLAASENSGGSGLSPVELALFFREAGRCCAPVDVLAQSLACLAPTEDASLQQALLDGTCAVSLAASDGEGLRLLGDPEAAVVLWAEPERARLYEASSLKAELCPSLDVGVTMRRAPRPETSPLAEAAGRHIWQMGQVATASMLVGVAETALDQIVEYAKIRETFGKKIGAYQAVRHACAEMALRVECARAQLWFTTMSMRREGQDSSAHLDVAKYLANDAARTNCDANIQLHGGIGVTEEHDAHLLLKRSLFLSLLFGANAEMLRRIRNAELKD